MVLSKTFHFILFTPPLLSATCTDLVEQSNMDLSCEETDRANEICTVTCDSGYVSVTSAPHLVFIEQFIVDAMLFRRIKLTLCPSDIRTVEPVPITSVVVACGNITVLPTLTLGSRNAAVSQLPTYRTSILYWTMLHLPDITGTIQYL